MSGVESGPRIARTFGHVAAEYERARPAYVTRAPYDRDRMTDLLLTTSTPAALAGDERAELRRRLLATLGGGYMLTVETKLYRGRLPS